MQISLSLKTSRLDRIRSVFANFKFQSWIVVLSSLTAISATYYSYVHDVIVTYGDAESHLNIAKRVVDSVTPGLAQLGGIWLPLPHLLMLPFVKFDILWRTGLAGSIVSGIAFIVACVFIYKLTLLLTNKEWPSFFAALVFMLNPNIMYLQSTPMTELALVVFFVLSSYYFIKFMKDDTNTISLILAAFFGLCAALSRYDGWFLVMAEAGILVLYYLPFSQIPKSLSQIREFWDRKKFEKMEGLVVMFSTLAFFGIVGWLFWDLLILGDPLYFTHSQFSAKSQQQGWLAHGQLPAYHNIWLSFIYYFVTSMSNVGVLVFGMALAGLGVYVLHKPNKFKLLTALLLTSVFAFYVVTLYIGQSIIFIPHITPGNFDSTLFNARYGVMMVPLAAIMIGILLSRSRAVLRLLIVCLFIFQFVLYGIGYSKVISLEDGVSGLSHARRPDAERFLKQNYDGGMVLIDDFARLTSIVRSGIPMENVIYVGNKPYWEESFVTPEKYARWIIVQQNDEIWNKIYEPLEMQGQLYKYFEKVYTSPEILLFKRNSVAIDSP